MVTPIKTTTIPKSDYKLFQEKSAEFFNVMNLCLNDQESAILDNPPKKQNSVLTLDFWQGCRELLLTPLGI